MRILPLLLTAFALLPALAAADAAAGCTATPAEYGLPPLNFGKAPLAPTPQTERDWQLPAATPLRACLLRIEHYGTAQAAAVLRDTRGQLHKLALRDMQAGDRFATESWVKSGSFIELPLLPQGSLCARVLELREPKHSMSFPHLEIRLMTPDGRIHAYCCNARSFSQAQARQYRNMQMQGRPCIFFADEGLERLRKADTSFDTAPQPLQLAADPVEAYAFAQLHGLKVVTLFLNRRGSEQHLAWQRYLREHPEAGAHWNRKYVFVCIHCDEQGQYPPEVLRQMHISQPCGMGDNSTSAALRTGSFDKAGLRFHSLPLPDSGCYSVADFLKTPPADITFDR